MPLVKKVVWLLLFFQHFILSAQNVDWAKLSDKLVVADLADRLQLTKAYAEALPTQDFTKKMELLLSFSKQQNWPAVTALAHRLSGLHHYRQGAYEKCLPHYQQALRLYQEMNDLEGQGILYNLLATFSKKQKAYAKTHEYLDKALAVCQAAKDSGCISTVYDNRGLVHAERGDFNQAEEQYLLALHIRQSLRDTIGLGYVYSNLAEVASHKGRYEQAESYIYQSNQQKLLSQDTNGLAINYTNLGEIYFNQKAYTKAVQHFNKSLEYSVATGFTDLSQWNYQFASRAYAAMGDTDKALSYLKQSHTLKDSLLTVEKLKQITEMETRFETAQKEQQIQLQQLQIENQQQRISNQRMLGVAILTAMVLLGLWLFSSYRNRQQLQLRQKQMVYQKQLLANTITVQEQERRRIARDLHDGIGQQLTGLKMAWQQLASRLGSRTTGEAAQLRQMEGVLNDTASEVRSLSHRMLPKALEAFGLVPAIEGLLEQSLSGIAYQFEQHGLEKRLPQSVELSVYRILQELINNILKHAQASEVNVQLYKTQQQLILVVEDNGKGFDVQQSANGHGLMNMASRAQAVGGAIHFESIPGEGTLATLTIPLS